MEGEHTTSGTVGELKIYVLKQVCVVAACVPDTVNKQINGTETSASFEIRVSIFIMCAFSVTELVCEGRLLKQS
jgi:hypothetical protein